MAEPKTKRTTASVSAYLAAIPDEHRRKDAKAIVKLMAEVSGEKPALWGRSIVGFGSYKGPSGDWPIVGFSPRKANLVLYLMFGLAPHTALLQKLGRHKTRGGCLYLNKLADVDEKVLRELVAKSVKLMREKHP